MNTIKFSQTKEVVRHAGQYIKGRVLDLGAGKSKYKSLLPQTISEYVAFDTVKRENIDVVGDILNLPFPDESFDTVICTQVLEHTKNPWLAAQQMHRILKPGGICVTTAPFFCPYHKDPGDYFRYTKDGLAEIFSSNGFKILENDGYGKMFSVLAAFVRFLYCNPYGGKVSPFREKVLAKIYRLARFLDRFIKNEIIYDSAFVIAQKE